VRTSWGDYLHHVGLEQWAAEHLTNFNTWVKFIHTKIILVDPLTETPTTLTGSANYSDNSTTDNEENTLAIRGGDAAKRVADIYLTEYQRLFMHFVYRDWAGSGRAGQPAAAPRLIEDPSWSAPHYKPGSWRQRQRTTFSAAIG
jgi:phosphatidylserine/phosphatidylglycerophosphate/cardiolipin synthase-like enzyme